MKQTNLYKNKITKHNNQHMMDEIKDEFDKLNKGKYKYSLSFQVRVRNNVGDKVKYHNEDRSGEFKDDREKKRHTRKQNYVYY